MNILNYILAAVCAVLLISLIYIIFTHDGVTYKEQIKRAQAIWVKEHAKDSLKIVAKYELKLQEKDEELAKLDSVKTKEIIKNQIKYVQVIKSIPLWSDDSLVWVVRDRYNSNLRN